MKKIELLFYKVNPGPENIGLKHVLFEVTEGGGKVFHDWGYAHWNGKEWDQLDVPPGWFCEIKYWANTVDPELLLKEKSKIIRL
jgi:hypothetical protein